MKKASLICLVMLLLVALFSGCDGDTPEPTLPADMNYAVCVQSYSGVPLAGIRVHIYENAPKEELVCIGVTDADGSYTFTAPTRDGYVAVLEKTADTLEVDAYYALAGEKTMIALSPKAMTDELLDSAELSLGDMMMDFSVTDCAGTKLQLSELLQKNKAVVLNFWYLKCEPCKMEFPFLQEAYEACGDDVAFLAMNPVDGDDASVSSFKTENGLTFHLASCDFRWQNVMNLSAYPTTVIVDRYGYIVAVHRGMLTDSTELISALEYIRSDGYQHEIFDSLAEVPSVNGN